MGCIARVVRAWGMVEVVVELLAGADVRVGAWATAGAAIAVVLGIEAVHLRRLGSGLQVVLTVGSETGVASIGIASESGVLVGLWDHTTSGLQSAVRVRPGTAVWSTPRASVLQGLGQGVTEGLIAGVERGVQNEGVGGGPFTVGVEHGLRQTAEVGIMSTSGLGYLVETVTATCGVRLGVGVAGVTSAPRCAVAIVVAGSGVEAVKATSVVRFGMQVTLVAVGLELKAGFGFVLRVFIRPGPEGSSWRTAVVVSGTSLRPWPSGSRWTVRWRCFGVVTENRGRGRLSGKDLKVWRG